MGPRLSLVVTTIGRVPEIVRLARSVYASPAATALELVVVDQSPDRRAARTVKELGLAFPIRTGTSEPSAPAGRKAGVALGAGDPGRLPNGHRLPPEHPESGVGNRFIPVTGQQVLAARV